MPRQHEAVEPKAVAAQGGERVEDVAATGKLKQDEIIVHCVNGTKMVVSANPRTPTRVSFNQVCSARIHVETRESANNPGWRFLLSKLCPSYGQQDWDAITHLMVAYPQSTTPEMINAKQLACGHAIEKTMRARIGHINDKFDYNGESFVVYAATQNSGASFSEAYAVDVCIVKKEDYGLFFMKKPDYGDWIVAFHSFMGNNNSDEWCGALHVPDIDLEIEKTASFKRNCVSFFKNKVYPALPTFNMLCEIWSQACVTGIDDPDPEVPPPSGHH